MAEAEAYLGDAEYRGGNVVERTMEPRGRQARVSNPSSTHPAILFSICPSVHL